MKLIIGLLFLFQVNCFANEWQLQAQDSSEHYKLLNEHGDSLVFEQHLTGKPIVTSVRKHKHLEIIVVNMGEVGTSCSVIHQDAFIFDKKNQKFLGKEYPFQRTSCGAGKVEWSYDDDNNKIHIYDINTDSTHIIKY